MSDLDDKLSGETHKLTVDDLQALKDFIEASKISETVENVKAGYYNYEAFINAKDNSIGFPYLAVQPSILYV